MARDDYPLPFQPHHVAPDSPGEQPLLFAFRRRELLVTIGHDLPPVAAIDEHGLEATRTQYLGRLSDVHCFSAELPDEAEAPEGMVFRDLRMLFGQFDGVLHTLAGRAVQIVEWDRTHQFCGACGERTELSEIDRSRMCPKCKIPLYPRLAPAMIVAVERDGEILMARGKNFPPGIYALIAGFVEPGESAEECVVREVYEETGIVVDDVRFFGSQPWPYPNSLMLGFNATYKSGEIRVDGEEIDEAGFYAPDAMPNTFPGNFSISQWLVHDFLRRHGR